MEANQPIIMCSQLLGLVMVPPALVILPVFVAHTIKMHVIPHTNTMNTSQQHEQTHTVWSRW